MLCDIHPCNEGGSTFVALVELSGQSALIGTVGNPIPCAVQIDGGLSIELRSIAFAQYLHAPVCVAAGWVVAH